MNDIQAKIAKLLALAESSNENEAKLALLRARELMAKYKLDMKDLKKTGGSKAKRQIWRRELRGVWNETFSASPLHRPRCAYLDRCRSQQKYGPLLWTGK